MMDRSIKLSIVYVYCVQFLFTTVRLTVRLKFVYSLSLYYGQVKSMNFGGYGLFTSIDLCLQYGGYQSLAKNHLSPLVLIAESEMSQRILHYLGLELLLSVSLE